MTYEVGEPSSEDCTHCRSKQTVEHRSVDGNNVTIARHCNMCRRDSIMWTGTKKEEKKRNAALRGNKNRMDAAARRLISNGGANPS